MGFDERGLMGQRRIASCYQIGAVGAEVRELRTIVFASRSMVAPRFFVVLKAQVRFQAMIARKLRSASAHKTIANNGVGHFVLCSHLNMDISFTVGRWCIQLTVYSWADTRVVDQLTCVKSSRA